MTGLLDSWQRQINYLRISVTDHCNLRCVYCSAGSVPHLPRSEVLSYEEIGRVVAAAVSLGISKVRLTGGEPLLRPGLGALVAMLAQTGGIDDVSLTTNGMLLGRYAAELRRAGLKRVNVSLDTLRRDRFKEITGGGDWDEVMGGIEAARLACLEPVKINVVILPGINDDETLDFARLTVNEGWHVRFIERMPFAGGRAASTAMISTRALRERIQSLGPLEPYTGRNGNGPARYYRLPGSKGTVGFIGPMTEHFCDTCNRLRLTADGHLRPCLLDDDEVDLKAALRKGADAEELKRLIQQAVLIKRERHHLNDGGPASRRPMRQIGG